MRRTAVTGERGETLVAEYLRQRGFIITERNYHSRYGEIDIIAESREYILFVEVKTRKVGSLASPREAVDYHKRKKIALTASVYLSKAETELQPRFDVAEVVFSGAEGREEYKINYIENAFAPEVM